MKRNKNFRLHQIKKYKNKTRKILKGIINNIPDEQEIGKHFKNRKKCSCEMCRNPRRSSFSKGKNKLTRQERRNEIR